MNIPWDLEATPLLIKTDSKLGSDEKIFVEMYNKDGGLVSSLEVLFSSTMQYDVHNCMKSLQDLPVQPPVEVDKIWTITKTETALIIIYHM